MSFRVTVCFSSKLSSASAGLFLVYAKVPRRKRRPLTLGKIGLIVG